MLFNLNMCDKFVLNKQVGCHSQNLFICDILICIYTDGDYQETTDGQYNRIIFLFENTRFWQLFCFYDIFFKF